MPVKVKVVKKKTAKKAPTKKKPTRKKRVAKKVVRKKVVKRVAKRGPGRPRRKGPGRPPKKRGRPAKKVAARRGAGTKGQIVIPVTTGTDLTFWSNLVMFLNANKNKTFVIQLDGKSISIGAV